MQSSWMHVWLGVNWIYINSVWNPIYKYWLCLWEQPFFLTPKQRKLIPVLNELFIVFSIDIDHKRFHSFFFFLEFRMQNHSWKKEKIKKEKTTRNAKKKEFPITWFWNDWLRYDSILYRKNNNSLINFVKLLRFQSDNAMKMIDRPATVPPTSQNISVPLGNFSYFLEFLFSFKVYEWMPRNYYYMCWSYSFFHFHFLLRCSFVQQILWSTQNVPTLDKMLTQRKRIKLSAI